MSRGRCPGLWDHRFIGRGTRPDLRSGESEPLPENGHSLKVKSKLAGKRVRCPECQAVIVVPHPEPREETDEFHDSSHATAFEIGGTGLRMGKLAFQTRSQVAGPQFSTLNSRSRSNVEFQTGCGCVPAGRSSGALSRRALLLREDIAEVLSKFGHGVLV